MAENSEDRIVEEIYDALDAGEADAALSRARIALHQLGEDPVLRFLAGVALLELDEPGPGAAELEKAVGLDPDDAEIRATYATALFRCCRFAEAAREAKRAIEADPTIPGAHHAAGLVAEREGRFEAADAAFAKATNLDPEGYPPPVRMSRAAFEGEVLKAGELLPEAFHRHLDDVAVTIEDIPSNEILLGDDPPLDPELLGLFVGRALDEKHFDGPGGDLPPRILLFHRNLERFAEDEDALRVEIARTLHHELAHYLGFEEDAMEGMDLD